MSIQGEHHGPGGNEPLSDMQYTEMLRLLDGDMDSHDSMCFNLDSMFDLSEASSTGTLEPSMRATPGSSFPQHGLLSDSDIRYEHPDKFHSTRQLSTGSRDRANVLKEWLKCHSRHPYPTRQEKTSLAEKAGLSVTQVGTWFANARRRRKSQPEALNNSMASTSPSNPLDDSPLERWKNSPPEVEAAPLDAIMREVARSDIDDLPDDGSLKHFAPVPRQRSPSHGKDARSQASSDASASALSSTSGSSAHSLGSNHSQGSFGCFYLNDSARRRRRRRTKTTHTSKRPAKSTARKRPYQCTFCTDTFCAKYDWTRHEKTLHLSLEKFICAPFGQTYNDQLNGTERCAFCDEASPPERHIDSHRVTICRQKPITLRTFYRKDHLLQHLRLVHRVNHLTPSMETWKSKATHINSRCGFCGDTFVLWSDRNDHIAEHYRKGASMKDWRGCRGLDPSVALAVENAMPPYLIGMESSGMEPFSASRLREKAGVTGPGTEPVDRPPATDSTPTPFEYLTGRLTEYVHKIQATGRAVTDEMLQTEARCIVYGDDDPWNQTAADSPEWLIMFKEGMGLESAHLSQPINSRSQIEDENYHFYLPWSAEQWTPYDPGANCVDQDALDMASGGNMAWSWLSPECLAEFRQHSTTKCFQHSEQAGSGPA